MIQSESEINPDALGFCIEFMVSAPSRPLVEDWSIHTALYDPHARKSLHAHTQKAKTESDSYDGVFAHETDSLL